MLWSPAQDPAPTAVPAVDRGGGSDQTRQLYAKHCAKCHGPDGVPKPIAKGAPRFADPAWAPPAEKLEAVITNGKGELMPKFKGRLSPEEVRELADFVLTLKNR